MLTRLPTGGDDVNVHEPLYVVLYRHLVFARVFVSPLYGARLPVSPVQVLLVLKRENRFCVKIVCFPPSLD